MQVTSSESFFRNVLWSKFNLVARYVSSFLATVVIARYLSIDDFSAYNLMLSYLGIYEAISFFHPNHIRNILSKNKMSINQVASIWTVQSLILWFGVFLSSIVLYIITKSQVWLLLTVASFRIALKFQDWVQLVTDSQVSGHYSQKLQGISHLAFNIGRVLAAWLGAGAMSLSAFSPLQGLVLYYQQKKLSGDLNITTVWDFSFAKFKETFRESFLLNLVILLAVVQSKISPIIVAEILPLEKLANFQLLIKLMEPMTTLASLVFAANYGLLARSVTESKSVYRKTTLRIAGILLFVTILSFISLWIFPRQIFLSYFGASYSLVSENLWLGGLLIVSSSVVIFSTQIDFVVLRYKKVLLKYLLTLLSLGGLFFIKNISTDLTYIVFYLSLVPIFIVLIIDTIYYFTRGPHV
ncbi:MAG: hypothetical protein ACLGGX_10835 [Bdellovibrionia bacterium]